MLIITRITCNYFLKYQRKKFDLNAAMINLGCDLTDVTESAIFGIVLQKLKIKSDIFSIDQLFEGRNMINESARLSPSKIKNIDKLVTKNYKFLILPGGRFYHDFFLDLEKKTNENTLIFRKVERVVKEFHSNGKPIIVSSNACLILNKILSKRNFGPGINLTAGMSNEEWMNKEIIQSITLDKNIYTDKDENEICLDKKNNIVSLSGRLKVQPNNFNVNVQIEKAVHSVLTKIKS